jgi:hypothetical protein
MIAAIFGIIAVSIFTTVLIAGSAEQHRERSRAIGATIKAFIRHHLPTSGGMKRFLLTIVVIVLLDESLHASMQGWLLWLWIIAIFAVIDFLQSMREDIRAIRRRIDNLGEVEKEG